MGNYSLICFNCLNYVDLFFPKLFSVFIGWSGAAWSFCWFSPYFAALFPPVLPRNRHGFLFRTFFHYQQQRWPWAWQLPKLESKIFTHLKVLRSQLRPTSGYAPLILDSDQGKIVSTLAPNQIETLTNHSLFLLCWLLAKVSWWKM